MQAIPLEQIENVLKLMSERKEKVMVRFFIFGTVELCLFGDLTMMFEDEDSTPFFFVQHKAQYATNIRFYGQDVKQIHTAANGVVEIYLGVPKSLTT